jgi:DNA-directed RNA polymerase specialized sigma24 family protein
VSPAELEALVTAAVEGDLLARIRLVSILRPVAYEAAWYKVFNHADADDVANLTMIRAMRRLHRLRKRRAVKAWTRKIARRLAMTLIAQRAAKPTDSAEFENIPDPGDGPTLVPTFSAASRHKWGRGATFDPDFPRTSWWPERTRLEP